MTTVASEAQILEELQALREIVAVLQVERDMRRRVRLQASPVQPFLGQPVTLTVTVTQGNLSGIGVPVTFVANWGQLHVAEGYLTEQGSTITTRTGLDGSASVSLLPPTSENLWREQQDALETALRVLNPEAATPHDTLAGLQEIARQYGWRVNTSLRRAMDIYFRDFGQALRELVNVRDFLDTWKYMDTTVVAYVPDDDGNVQSSAVLRLRYKDWLGAWLQTYLEVFEEASHLPSEFDNVKQRGGRADTLLDTMHARVRDFLKNQQGFIDTYASRKIAESSLRTFLNARLGDVPAETRYRLTPALESVATTIATTGMNALTTLSQVRADLQQAELGEKVNQFETDLSGRVNEAVDAVVGTLASDRIGGALHAALSNFQTEVGKLHTDTLTGLETKMGQLHTNTLEGLKGEATSIRTDIISDLQTAATGIRTSTFQGLQTDVTKLRNDSLNGMQTEATGIRTSTLQGLQTDATKLRTNMLSGLQTDVTKLRSDTFSGLQADVTTMRSDTLTGLQSEATGIRSSTREGLQTEATGIRTSTLQGLQTDATKLRTNTLSGLQTDVTKLRSDTFSGFQADVTKVRTDTLKELETEVTKLGANALQGLQTDVTNCGVIRSLACSPKPQVFAQVRVKGCRRRPRASAPVPCKACKRTLPNCGRSHSAACKPM